MAKSCNFERINCGIERIAILYGVALILGLEIALSELFDALFTTPRIEFMRVFELLAYFSVVLLIVLRFFWAISNIHRYFEHRVHTKAGPGYLATRRAMAQFLLLLIQSALILAMCKAFALFADSGGGALLFLSMATAIIVFNGIWLGLLIIKRANKEPELTWSTNNLVCGSLATLVLVAGPALSYPQQLVAWIVLIFLTANSLMDLLSHSGAYFDDDARPAKQSPFRTMLGLPVRSKQKGPARNVTSTKPQPAG